MGGLAQTGQGSQRLLCPEEAAARWGFEGPRYYRAQPLWGLFMLQIQPSMREQLGRAGVFLLLIGLVSAQVQPPLADTTVTIQRDWNSSELFVSMCQATETMQSWAQTGAEWACATNPSTWGGIAGCKCFEAKTCEYKMTMQHDRRQVCSAGSLSPWKLQGRHAELSDMQHAPRLISTQAGTTFHDFH